MQPSWSSRWMLMLFAVLGVLSSVARAQVATVEMTVEPGFVGLSGAVRGGSWAPLRLTLRNQGAEARAVRCRWLLQDYDGDEVIAERLVTLNPQRDQFVWLYAVPPMSLRDRPTWRLEVVDAETEELLAGEVSPPAANLGARSSAVGVFGAAELGLEPYTRQYTQHEPMALVRGLEFATLPDRWYGLDMLQALVWTRLGGNPDEAEVTAALQSAVRSWVRRGGHLVIVLPEVGEPWSGSPLSDLMPVTPGQMRRIEAEPPKFLYDIAPAEPITMGMTVFDRPEASGASAVLRNELGDALVVAKRYGFGRVTLIGVDLSDERLRRLGMPQGSYRIWNVIFGWNGPVIAEDAARPMMQDQKLSDPQHRATRKIDEFIPPVIGMTGTAGPALLAAIAVFAIYFAATPLTFAMLRQRKQTRRAWPVFVLVVLGFTAVTWGGAWLLRPRSVSVAHFSVLDVDARSGEVRTQSWLSLFVPEFGHVPVAIGPEDTDGPGGPDVMWAPGLSDGLEDAGFPDTETYTVDAASPDAFAVPMRATAKQLQAEYLGPLNDSMEGVTDAWVVPQGTLRLDESTGFPAGTLQHGLPGPLANLLVVYVPAGGADPRPWVWRVGEWPAMTPLQLASPARMGLDTERLVRRLADYQAERNFRNEGFLGSVMSRVGGGVGLPEAGGQDPFRVSVPDDQRAYMIELLSFFDTLPPPDYARGAFSMNPPVSFHRPLGRGLDLTHLTVGGRVILIGQLENSTLPLPLTVDGDAVPSEGRTVVRWIYDL